MSAGRSRELCIMACTFCRDKQFHAWMEAMARVAGLSASTPAAAFDEQSAKVFILASCGIESRNDLDTNAEAAARFHAQVRLPFVTWRDAQQQLEQVLP